MWYINDFIETRYTLNTLIENSHKIVWQHCTYRSATQTQGKHEEPLYKYTVQCYMAMCGCVTKNQELYIIHRNVANWQIFDYLRPIKAGNCKRPHKYLYFKKFIIDM